MSCFFVLCFHDLEEGRSGGHRPFGLADFSLVADGKSLDHERERRNVPGIVVTTATGTGSMDSAVRIPENMKMKSVDMIMGNASAHTSALGVRRSMRTVTRNVLSMMFFS